ncbi:MAG: hypothetical protein DMF61_19265 [Blastocatellia bacterium AA13]|nr:MAG: hypothetical protein DMF61_19265 [Blastocatellia bacterium AA13]
MNVIRKSMVIVSMLLLASIALAAENVKLNGYIIDNMCGGMHAKDANAEEVVKHHKKSCALMDGCKESGYAVFANGKLYKLDEGGNQKVVELLKKSKSERGFAVQVEGSVEGDTITVSSISETAPEKK